MKIINYFYLLPPDEVFCIFREVYDERIPDHKVQELVERCLKQIPTRVQIYEWFLLERRMADLTSMGMTKPAPISVYLMSSDNSKVWINPEPQVELPISIGFSAIAKPISLFAWVDL